MVTVHEFLQSELIICQVNTILLDIYAFIDVQNDQHCHLKLVRFTFTNYPSWQWFNACYRNSQVALDFIFNNPFYRPVQIRSISLYVYFI